jgi:metallo-beta-lactamase family protein
MTASSLKRPSPHQRSSPSRGTQPMVEPFELAFFGGTGTVTGSKYLISYRNKKVLVDCGLFQGFKLLRLRNWAPPPFDARKIDAVVLTHAHIDHSGYLPLLAKNGFRGPVYCSRATEELCRILLPDAGHLQEEEANYVNRHAFSKHKPAQPLYTVEDAKYVLTLLRAVDFGQMLPVTEGMSVRFDHNGHILGSSALTFDIDDRKLVFSGDLGRPDDAIMRAPATLTEADYIVVESTYGNRLHEKIDPADALCAVVDRTLRRSGVVVIPAFAVGRAQSIICHLHRLQKAKRIANVPIYLNSPMAVDATRLFARHQDEHKLSHDEYQELFRSVKIVNTPEDSRRLNTLDGPMVIVSASGMATGGRVLHHIQRFAPDSKNTILFAGFQAAGTRGAKMVEGATEIKMFGSYVPIRAEVANLASLSSHGDYNEILGWLKGFQKAPKMAFVTHGEPAAADAMRIRISETLGWPCEVPDYLQHVTLS